MAAPTEDELRKAIFAFSGVVHEREKLARENARLREAMQVVKLGLASKDVPWTAYIEQALEPENPLGPIRSDLMVPPDEAWLVRDGKVVAKIVNIGE